MPPEYRARLSQLISDLEIKQSELIETKTKLIKTETELIGTKTKLIETKTELDEKYSELIETKTVLHEISLEKLLKQGVPKCKFLRNSDSYHTSNHKPALIEIKDDIIQSILLNENIQPKTTDEKGKLLTSTYLTTYKDVNKEHYASEITIHNFVVTLLSDILKLANKKESLSLLQEKSISTLTNVGCMEKMAPDVWLIKTISGRPISVIEVKSPKNDDTATASVLNDTMVIGQLFDYMLKPNSFHGQTDIIGVVTDFNYWRVCWFPHSDEYMSDSIPTKSRILDSTDRKLHGTSLINVYKNPNLIKILIAIIMKSVDAKIYSVPLLSCDRHYIRFQTENTGANWNWEYLKNEDIKSMNLTLNYPKITNNRSSTNVKEIFTASIIVLRYYNGGEESNVFLGLNKVGNMFVVKQFLKIKDFEKEENLWQKINLIKCLSKKFYNGIESLIMPFVYTCTKQKSDNDKNQVSFNFELYDWCFEDGAKPESMVQIDSINKQVENVLKLKPNLKNCKNIAEQLIEDIARKGYIHNDLHWRHVGLLPIYDKSNTSDNNDLQIIDLKPVLIDLASVTEFKREKSLIQAAISKMKKKLLILD